MAKHVLSTTDSEDQIPDSSTAPTSPEGSLTFSPSLQPSQIRDAINDVEYLNTRSCTSSSTPPLDSRRGSVQNICCIGAGYVGGPTAAVLAYQNPHLKITVVDRDRNRIAQWNSKHIPLYEPGLREILRIARDGSKAITFPNGASKNRSSLSSVSSTTSQYESECVEYCEINVSARQPNLFFSTDISRGISEANIIMIAINTPAKGHGVGAGKATDITALEAVTREIAIHAKPGTILVEKSTVPCRTADMIRDILEIYQPHASFTVLSNPEFLSAGTAVSDLMNPSRVLIGCQPTPAGKYAASLLRSIYYWVSDSKILTTNVYSSELAKLVANSILAQRISSINSISAICEKTGAEVNEISKAVGLDNRIGSKYLQAGVGFGGSCFGKDIQSLIYLAEGLNLPEVAEYWGQVLKMNDWQLSRFVRRVVRCLNGTLIGKKVTILGYAFKKGTNDTRESPALESIKIFLEDTPKEIAIYDPFCDPEIVREEIVRLLGAQYLRQNGGAIEVFTSGYEACAGSHAVVIMTECDEFRNSSTSSPRSGSNHKDDDPRPFKRLQSSESDILKLHNYLVCNTQSVDPLSRFMDEPACEEGCKSCSVESKTNKNLAPQERLDWAKIAYHLQRPRWIFDGRNVLDISEIEKLGCRVESIGRAGRGGL